MNLGFAIPHEIRIRASANMGFIVTIGCGEFVAAHDGALIQGLKDYLGDPKKWEKEYNELSGRDGDEVTREEPSRPVRVAPPTPPDEEIDTAGE